MNLRDRQSIFARNVAKIIEWAFANGYEVTLGEAWRSEFTAAEYAKQGKGIARSLHVDRLAIDLNLFRNGVYLTASEDYARLGAAWCQLDPLNRWGGDFTTLKDGNHLSMSCGDGRA